MKKHRTKPTKGKVLAQHFIVTRAINVTKLVKQADAEARARAAMVKARRLLS